MVFHGVTVMIGIVLVIWFEQNQLNDSQSSSFVQQEQDGGLIELKNHTWRSDFGFKFAAFAVFFAIFLPSEVRDDHRIIYFSGMATILSKSKRLKPYGIICVLSWYHEKNYHF